ncbi:hypothetical protein [Pseudovibrio ascidiaceicola]|uniref:hypothetical protein n=1 Tax=Pseudovibrio ascidiaceicola TaxID=285279 RepID=UPI001356B263|nr:hypothetical protein [Pseudovibrio ascidiaceicola]
MRGWKAIVFLCLAVVLSACVDIELLYDFAEDGSVTQRMTYKMTEATYARMLEKEQQNPGTIPGVAFCDKGEIKRENGFVFCSHATENNLSDLLLLKQAQITSSAPASMGPSFLQLTRVDDTNLQVVLKVSDFNNADSGAMAQTTIPPHEKAILAQVFAERNLAIILRGPALINASGSTIADTSQSVTSIPITDLIAGKVDVEDPSATFRFAHTLPLDKEGRTKGISQLFEGYQFDNWEDMHGPISDYLQQKPRMMTCGARMTEQACKVTRAELAQRITADNTGFKEQFIKVLSTRYSIQDLQGMLELVQQNPTLFKSPVCDDFPQMDRRCVVMAHTVDALSLKHIVAANEAAQARVSPFFKDE